MVVLQRSTRVRLSLEEAKRCWGSFASGPWKRPRRDAISGEGPDPGTVYFTRVDDETTEVTIQVDPSGLTAREERTVNRRVDSFLESFKDFLGES